MISLKHVKAVAIASVSVTVIFSLIIFSIALFHPTNNEELSANMLNTFVSSVR